MVAFRILYVDDEPDLLELGRIFLERGGHFIVDTIDSAPAALSLLKSTKYDAIIADFQMPDMNGIELLKKVRTSGNHIPFILFTGQGREEIVIEAINNGATYYLQKGGTPKVLFTELEHKIREAIRRQNAERALLESEARYRAVFENSGTAIIIIEEDMTIQLCNNEFLRLTGSSREDVEGIKSLTEFVYPEDFRDICDRLLFRRMHRDQGAQQFDTRVLTRTGSILSVSMTADSIPGTMKSVVSLVDITERKRLEEKLKTKEDEILVLYEYLASDNKTIPSPGTTVARQGDNEIMEQKNSRKTYVTAPEKSRPIPIRMWDMDFHPQGS